jgi:hypothetical protein
MSKGIACLVQVNCPKQEAPKQMRWPLLKVATVLFLLEDCTIRLWIESMWRKLVRGYQQFAEDAPGQRFVDAHQRWKGTSKNPITSFVIIAASLVLIAAGALLGLVPGVPGIVLGVVGLALMATRFRRVAIWLDWSETKCRNAWQRFRHRKVLR